MQRSGRRARIADPQRYPRGFCGGGFSDFVFFLEKTPELFISPGEQRSHHSLMASLTSRVEMKALEYLRGALMPDHEVCLSAFGIPDPGNQSERSLFVSECRRSSPRLPFLN